MKIKCDFLCCFRLTAWPVPLLVSLIPTTPSAGEERSKRATENPKWLSRILNTSKWVNLRRVMMSSRVLWNDDAMNDASIRVCFIAAPKLKYFFFRFWGKALSARLFFVVRRPPNIYTRWRSWRKKSSLNGRKWRTHWQKEESYRWAKKEP